MRTFGLLYTNITFLVTFSSLTTIAFVYKVQDLMCHGV